MTAAKTGPGRPTLGHEGHLGRSDRCAACTIRRWREARGLTQAAAAHMVPSGTRRHSDPRTWQRWERAESPVPLLVLRLLEMLDQMGPPPAGRRG